MIETGKKYKLKKIRGFENSDNEYYKVISFYNFDTVICKNAYGERFVFMKEFLIDPLWNKGFEFKNTRNRLIDLYLEKQIC